MTPVSRLDVYKRQTYICSSSSGSNTTAASTGTVILSGAIRYFIFINIFAVRFCPFTFLAIAFLLISMGNCAYLKGDVYKRQRLILMLGMRSTAGTVWEHQRMIPEPRFILHQINTELSLQNGQTIKMCLLEILQRSLSGWSRILLLILNMNIDSAAATAQVK